MDYIQPGWGLRDTIPTNATAWRGWRFIFKHYSAPVFMPGRSDNGESNKEHKRALINWCKNTAMPAVNALCEVGDFHPLQANKHTHEEEHDGLRFVLVANTNASGGYLYVSCWVEPA